MSPEQLRGQTVDHRSDIFSFGAVFYEMLCGRHAFIGDTNADTMIAILKEDPLQIPGTAPVIPPAMERIVRHCLEKDPEARFQSAHDLGFALEAVSTGTGVSGVAITPPVRPKAALDRRALRWVAGALALLGVLSLGALIGLRGRSQILPIYHQLTFRRGTIWSARFAPDGHTIVYSATWSGNPLSVFSSLPESPESRSLGLAGADLLAVSQSGEMAVLLHAVNQTHFISRGTLARVPLGGGSPREILDDVQQADWSPDGSGLAVVHLVGDRARLEYPIGKTLYETSGWIGYPRISPQGDRIAFMEHDVPDDDRGWISVLDLAGKKTRLSGEWASEQGMAWSRDGNEVWFTATKSGEPSALHAVTLSGKERVLARVPANLMIHDIAGDGSVLMVSYSYSTPVVALAAGQIAERDLTSVDGVRLFDLSSDGKSFVMQYYGEGSGTNYISYLGKTDGSSPIRLGEGAALALSPDGRWVLAALNFPHRQSVLLPTGPGQMRYLEHHGIEDLGDGGWMPDGKQIIFTGREAGKSPRCYVQNIDGGEARAVTPEGITGSGVRLLVSPDGKNFLAIDPAGKRLLFPLAGGEAHEIRGLGEGDHVIRWAADGRNLYFYRTEENIRIYVLDPVSGHSELLREFMPSDRAGILGGPTILLSADGKLCVYSFGRYLSQLYLVTGLT
jgi:Tol biopolymer transport system component